MLQEHGESSRRLGEELGLPFEKGSHVFPSLQGLVVAHEARDGALVRRVDGENLLESVGRLLVVQKLFFVNGGRALPERDLLAWCGRRFDLLVEVQQEVLEATRLREQPVEAAQGIEVLGIGVEHRLVALPSSSIVVQVELVELGNAAKHAETLVTA